MLNVRACCIYKDRSIIYRFENSETFLLTFIDEIIVQKCS